MQILFIPIALKKAKTVYILAFLLRADLILEKLCCQGKQAGRGKSCFPLKMAEKYGSVPFT